MKQQSNKNRPENAGKCICESLEPQNFPGEHAPGHAPPDPPLGLRQIYPPVTLKYPLVQKLIETPDGAICFPNTYPIAVVIYQVDSTVEFLNT